MIGKLNRRLQLQSRTVTRSSGSASESWSIDKKIWGAMDPRTGNERYQADQLTSVNEVGWIVRYDSDITPDKRFVDENSVIYKILSVVPYRGGRHYMSVKTEVKY